MFLGCCGGWVVSIKLAAGAAGAACSCRRCCRPSSLWWLCDRDSRGCLLAGPSSLSDWLRSGAGCNTGTAHTHQLGSESWRRRVGPTFTRPNVITRC